MVKLIIIAILTINGAWEVESDFETVVYSDLESCKKDMRAAADGAKKLLDLAIGEKSPKEYRVFQVYCEERKEDGTLGPYYLGTF